ncbi:MAG: histidine kinase [Chloroflexota bacterium]
MSRSVGRRFLIVAGMLLAGSLAAKASLAFLFPHLDAARSNSILLIAGLLACALGIVLDEYTARSGGKPNMKNRLEAELLQLNQELEQRSSEQNKELARLNIELELQMAMHQQAEEFARANEERFRNLADNIQDGITILENGKLVYLNERACQIFGDCPEGDLQNRLRVFALPREIKRLEAVVSKAVSSGVYPAELEYWIKRKDGEKRCLRERYSTSQEDGIQRTFVVTSDITERIQAYRTLENAVKDRTRELSTVLEVSKRIASTLELEPLLHLILDQIQAILPYSGAAIYTRDGEMLRVAAYQAPGLPHPGRPLFLSLPNAGPYQPVIAEKKVVIFDDVNGEPPLARAIRESLGEGTGYSFRHARAWIGIPLVLRDHVTGLLSLTHNEPGYYTQTHARLAETITNQVAVAIENARLYEKAQNLATLEERQRIARELHDSVTQLLYGICLYCTATSHSIRGENYQHVQENLAEIKDNALQALQEMRLLILEMNPPLLQKDGLVAALQASLETIESRAGLETELRADGVKRLPRALEPELYRIAMEALNNLVRYARARKVSVDLHTRSGWIILEICDNGVGFDLEQAWNSGGMGLHSMEQRARQIGGRLEITSSPGAGTRIRAEVPEVERWLEPT